MFNSANLSSIKNFSAFALDASVSRILYFLLTTRPVQDLSTGNDGEWKLILFNNGDLVQVDVSFYGKPLDNIEL